MCVHPACPDPAEENVGCPRPTGKKNVCVCILMDDVCECGHVCHACVVCKQLSEVELVFPSAFILVLVLGIRLAQYGRHFLSSPRALSY